MPDLAATNAIDLSQLPPPDLIEALDYEAVYAEVLALFQSLFPGHDSLLDSDPAIKLLQAFAYRIVGQIQRVNDAARAVMLAYATGADLDQLAALFGVGRLLIAEADAVAGTPAVYEPDADLRSRVLLAPESYSVAGPASAYVFHARSAHPDVASASASSPAPGEVLVAILSRNGTGLASQEMIDAVIAALDDEVRPLTDQVTVQSAAIVDFAIEAELTLFSGPDPAVVTTAASEALNTYLAQSRLIGRNINRSAIFAALHREGVARVNLIAPADDIDIDELSAANCSEITLSTVGGDV